MMRPFPSLFAKILFWFFLNLALVAAVFVGFFAFQSQMDLGAFFGRQTIDRMHIAGRLISHDLKRVPQAEWPDVLTRFSEIHLVNFALLLKDGATFLSKRMDIPDDVLKTLRDTFRFKPPPFQVESEEAERAGKEQKRAGQGAHHRERPRLMIRSQNPTRYWARIIIPVSTAGSASGVPAMLVAESDSITGHGFFFDPLPWMIVTGAVLLISVLLWIPLVRNITRPLARMTSAAEGIARGRFDVRIDEARADEIGRLAGAINHMTLRLNGFIKGQKRFLGDVAHELASPVARIQLGLGILEQHVSAENSERLADVSEDVAHMSNLINELLSFSRAEINPGKVTLEPVEVLPLVRRAVEREGGAEAEILIKIEPEIRVMAAPDLLARALANLVRNAVRYAGDAGPIQVSAEKSGDSVLLEVSDAGPGVRQELLEQLFEPFFRPEPSRNRDSGGVGLGLAIVKTCIETCNGSVSARNLKPKGFAVSIILGA